MRDPNRIDPFLNELGKLWKENCPDWRFLQLIENVFGDCTNFNWYMEEPQASQKLEQYFNNKIKIKTRRRKNESRNKK